MKFLLSLLLPVCISLAPLYSVSEVPDLLPVYKSDQLDADEQITLEDLAIALGTAHLTLVGIFVGDVEKATDMPRATAEFILEKTGIRATLEELRDTSDMSMRQLIAEVVMTLGGPGGAIVLAPQVSKRIILDSLKSLDADEVAGNNPAEKDEVSQIVLTDSGQEQLIISL